MYCLNLELKAKENGRFLVARGKDGFLKVGGEQRKSKQILISFGHWTNEWVFTVIDILAYYHSVYLLTFGGYEIELYFPWYKNHCILFYFKVIKCTLNLTGIFRYKFSFVFKDPDSDSFHQNLGYPEIGFTIFIYVMIKCGSQ